MTYTASSATATCAYTGAAQTFTIPAGVSSVTATVDGASGGDVDGVARGGNGGRVVATLAEQPGTVLTVIVGQAGSFGGGATVGGGAAPGSGGIAAASGGGGSFVQAADGTNLLVAGGGGGAANWGCGKFGSADGGDGDGGGVTGRSGSSDCPTGAGGSGGTSHGGSGVGQGTDGGDNSGFGSPGGGGGGGYDGGHGGRVIVTFPAIRLGGAGGGGSGYCGPGLDCTFTTGAHDGNGLVTFTWGLSGPRVTSTDTTAFTVAAEGAFTVTADGVPQPTLSLSGDALPAGMTFSDNHDGTGTLSGAPDPGTAGSYSLIVGAHSQAGDDMQTLTLTVDAITPTVTVVADPDEATDPGGPVVVTATISGDAGLPAGGTVDFAAAGIALCDAVPVHEGRASCVTGDLPPGQHLVTATYSGDAGTYADAEGSVTHLVRSPDPTTDTTTTEPTTTESTATESITTEPITTEPETTEPETTKPETTDPIATGPATATSPEPTTEAVTTAPATTAPTATGSTTVDPTTTVSTKVQPATTMAATGDLAATGTITTAPTTSTHGLAVTGTAALPRVLAGLALLLTGASLVWAGRRRRHS